MAFGASGAPKRLAGGRGVTWRTGGVVLRPVGDPVESMWKSKVLSELDVSDEFTFPQPIQDDRGQWVRDGWEAMEFIGFGAAIAVVDAVSGHRYPIQRLGHDHGTTHWRQLLLRALAFRMVTLRHLGRWDQNHYERHAPIMAAVIALPSR